MCEVLICVKFYFITLLHFLYICGFLSSTSGCVSINWKVGTKQCVTLKSNLRFVFVFWAWSLFISFLSGFPERKFGRSRQAVTSRKSPGRWDAVCLETFKFNQNSLFLQHRQSTVHIRFPRVANPSFDERAHMRVGMFIALNVAL